MWTPEDVKSEAKRLYEVGLAIHWLKKKEKIPVKSGWSGDNKDPLPILLKEYKEGFNIGTKLGKPSFISTPFSDEGYLAVLDVDVKGSEKKHQNAARSKVQELFPGLIDSAPITLSGRGNGSMHIWCIVEKPFDSFAVFSSNEMVEVFMPSAKPTQNQIDVLGEKKVKEGWRLRPAFEIDFMCNGRQVVLPPSIHPDSGKKYKWEKVLKEPMDLPFLDIEEFKLHHNVQAKQKVGRNVGSTIQPKLIPQDVDELELEMKLKPDVINMIIEGEDVGDRSAACLSIALSMIHAGFNDNQIAGVLTDRKFFIGDVAFEHAKTSNRLKAVNWVERYCIEKAHQEINASDAFESEVEVYETLPKEKAQKQKKEIVNADEVDKAKMGKDHWKLGLDYSNKGVLLDTAKNIALIFENVIGKKCISYDSFSFRQFITKDTPWGSAVGSLVQDLDYTNAKFWLAHAWDIEPSTSDIKDAFNHIASKNVFNSVYNHLMELPEWDGTPRLSTWLKRILGVEAPEPYLSEVSKKFIMGAVARVLDPGCKLDCTLIIEGVQGLGKSTVGRVLATDKWFLDSLPDLHDKDALQLLQGHWFIEFGELASLRRSDVETIKNFLTKQEDRFRPPYGTNVAQFQRQCVFFGTTNSFEYLKDKTGNRRFWPVKARKIDIEVLKEERDQLFAEAMFLYDLGEKIYMENTSVEYKQALEIQSDKVVEDESDEFYQILKDWHDNVMKKRKQVEEEKGKKLKPLRFCSRELFDDFTNFEDGITSNPPLGEYKNHKYKFQLISNALNKIGYKKVKSNGQRMWEF